LDKRMLLRHLKIKDIVPEALSKGSLCWSVLIRCLLIGATLLSGSTFATPSIDIVISRKATFYQQTADAIASDISQTYPTSQIKFHYADNQDLHILDPDSLLISIGTLATEATIQKYPEQPQLCLVITSEAWKSLSINQTFKHKAVIYFNQPVERLMSLARVLAPKAYTFATLLGPTSAKYEQRLINSANTLNAQLNSQTITTNSNSLGSLTTVINDADLFLALPNDRVLIHHIAKWALLLAFKHKIPVFGFSKAYTEAGAAASIYSSHENITRQAVEWLGIYLAKPGQALGQTYDPEYFTISVNPSVVGILGLDTTSEIGLHRKVSQLIGKTKP